MTDSLFAPELPNAPPARTIEGRVRLCKDTIRAGKWFCGGDPNDPNRYVTWTPDQLQALCDRFNEHAAAGIGHPLVWDHRISRDHGSGQGDTSELDSIADIAEMWTDGESLCFSVYVPENVRDKLTEKSRQCSPFFVWDWTDGTGKTWPGPSILNIGCVAHAVVPNQQPFVAMGIGSPSQPPSQGTSKMTFDVVLAAVNRLLDRVKPGAALPTDGEGAVTEENIDTILPVVVNTILGAEDPPADGADTPTVDAPPVPDGGGELAMSLRQMLAAELNPIRDAITALTGKRVADAQGAWNSRVESLCKSGVKAKHREKMLAMGAKVGFDLSYLDVYGSGDAVRPGSDINGVIEASEPATGGPSAAELAEARKFMRLQPKK